MKHNILEKLGESAVIMRLSGPLKECYAKDNGLGKYSVSGLLWHTVCPRCSDPFYRVRYYIKWITTSWTYCSKLGITFLSYAIIVLGIDCPLILKVGFQTNIEN